MRKLVWGIPIRAFHWVLFGLICVSYYTAKFGDFDSIDNHMLAGYGVIALILFRLMLGFFGKGHIRFTEFVKGPGSIIEYLRNPQSTTGHNPLGALGIIALLLSVGVQAGTGLFTSDEIFVEGPLYHLVSSETASLLSQIHGINQWVLLGLISLHIAAVLYHVLIRKEAIVGAMFHGKKEVSEGEPEQAHQFVLALISISVAGSLTWYLVTQI